MHSDDIEIRNYPISRTNTAKIVGFNRLELLDRELIPWLKDDIEIKNYPISRINTAKIVGFNRLELLDRE